MLLFCFNNILPQTLLKHFVPPNSFTVVWNKDRLQSVLEPFGFFFIPLFWGSIWLYSVLSTASSVLQAFQGIWRCWRWNLNELHTRKVPCLLYYLSGSSFRAICLTDFHLLWNDIHTPCDALEWKRDVSIDCSGGIMTLW